MNARKCDRCGSFYEPYSNWNGADSKASRDKKPSGIMFTLTTEDNGRYTHSEWAELPHDDRKVRDLCQFCMEALLTWWNKPKNEPVIVYEPISSKK